MNRTVAMTENQLDDVFQALANSTRRALLGRLRRGPAMVTDLAKPFKLSLNAISKHLMVLERAGLIKRTVEGRVHSCSLGAKPMAKASEWLLTYQSFWEGSLDSLARFVESGEDLKVKK
jgi:DNA-binding transcriptional ArsR family regulator